METTTSHLTALAQLLYERQQNASLCDFTIECADGRISAHKLVLAAGSRYFKALLSSDLAEVESRVVHLRDIGLATMMKVVEFIYTGRTTLDNSNGLDIVTAAHYLQIDNLITHCCAYLVANLNADTVVKVYDVADLLSLVHIREFAFGYLVKNIMSLMTVDTFLEGVDLGIMQALLASDDLVVPDEDTVFHLLLHWINNDPEIRMAKVDSLKELIRFPFLKVDTVTRLEEIAGKLRAMPMSDDPNTWDFSLAAFRQRQYTRAHCHLLWQKFGRSKLRKLSITCDVLGESHNDLVDGPWQPGTTKLTALAVSGRTMYAVDSPAVFRFDTQTGLTTRKLCALEAHSPTFNTVSLCATDAGTLHAVIESNPPKIFVLDTAKDTFCPVKSLSAKDQRRPSVNVTFVDTVFVLPNTREPLSVYDTIVTIVDSTSGQWEEFVDTERNVLSDWDFPYVCRGVLLRGKTLFVHYRNGQRHDLFTTLNLVTRKWGRKFGLPDRPFIYGEVQLREIQTKVYLFMRDVLEGITVYRLDEKNEKFDPVDRIRLSDSTELVGLVARDAGPACALDTWLDSKCRMLPDKTSAQRATIERLRRIGQGYVDEAPLRPPRRRSSRLAMKS